MPLLSEWRFRFRLAWDDPVIRWVGLSTSLVLLAGVLYTGIRVVSSALSTGLIVSHYTVYLGIDQVVPLPWVGLVLSLPVLLVGGTLLFTFFFYRQDSTASFSLLFFSVGFTVLWLVYFFYFIQINT